MSKKAKRRRIIVKAVECFLYAMQYLVGAALMIGALILFCFVTHLILKALGVA